MKCNCVHTLMLACFVCLFTATSGQQKKYSTANAHAHNDYAHPEPFFTAYNSGFGSIEADIFLRNGWLYVAHDSADIRPGRTLSALYLDPLWVEIAKNKGTVYPKSRQQLILLIDIKTAAEPTLDALLVLLSIYKSLTTRPTLKIVITGNRPAAAKWPSYPSWLFFDGRPNENYNAKALSKVALFSDNFRFYSSWNGEGAPGDQDVQRISAAVKKAHDLKKPIRFWATPDNQNAWLQMMQLGIDYINTDKIAALAEFLRSKRN